MKHYLRMLMAAWSLSLSLPAFAQQRPQMCSEGRTITGQCANVLTSRFGRSNAILYSQARISYSAPLTRPRDDRYGIGWQFQQWLRTDDISFGIFGRP